ncbi:fungal-specific transcription factor domain-containing protein [Colletotrichum falcatum]|nr:fungal-specific transcription factor domain-containing protein [Colletotrichum falcatum]
MTRPKVPEDKRQRTAQACDTCKRRKQKCNGSRPCATCTKRSLVCTYTTGNGSEQTPPDQIASPSKRRNVEELPTSNPAVPEGSLASASPAAAATTPWESKPQQPAAEENPTVGFDIQPSIENDHDTTAADREFDIRSRHSTASGPDEETSLIQSTRMLQDPTGRLLYVGDSASLAYLQLIRMIVEASVGPSDFTLDPSRHKIMEATIAMPANIRPPHILPDRDTANAMIDSFFTNAALSLMAVYMLAVSKRNAAYAYFGMAVRSGFALGLHRVQENHFIFKSHEIRLRRNLWRSLFVLDRFLAASLGRPVAIDEEECSTEALLVFEKNAQGELVRVTDPNDGLDAAVRSCRIIGQILKKIYARRRISVRLAQEIWEQCSSWYSTLSPDLAGGRVAADASNPAQGIAALHVNLLYCHSILLLTRPFFLCLLSKVHGERSGLSLPVPRWINRMSRYCEACLHASSQTINLVQKAYESNYLPQRNPFVLYFLFAASLIILSNEFAAVYPNPSYQTSISNTIAIMRYCAASDPQANRLLFILTSFRNVVYEVRQKKTEQPAMPAPPTLSPTSTQDPIGTIFQSSRVSRKNSFATITSGPSAVAVKAMAPPPPSTKTDHSFSTPTGPPAGHSPAGSTPGMSQGEQSVRMSGDSDTADGELEFDQLWGWSAVPNMAGAPLARGSAAVPAGAPQALMTAATPPNAPTFQAPGPGQGFHGFPNFIVPGGPNGGGVPVAAPPGYVATPNVPMYVPAEYS